MSNNFNDTLNIFKSAVEKAGITKEETELLMYPNRVINKNFPVKLSDNSIKMFNGYRVQYNNALGPYKGGIRFHPKVDMEKVKSLAFWMAIKCAIVNIPMGGGKGGITFNPKKYSKEDLEKISRAFVRQIADFIGSNRDVPAPDVYTNPEIMDIMVDEYSKIKEKDLAAFTGKSPDNGGLKMRMYSTSMGGAFILQKMITEKNKLPEKTTVAIQGMGNAGSNMAKILSEWGFKIIAVSDSKGGTYNKEGLDIEKIIQYKQETKNVKGFTEGEDISNEDLLSKEVDVLVPSALSCAITPSNINKIKAKIIVELANGPICNLTEDDLKNKNIEVIPDILANAGGVVGSYFEWRNNKNNIKENEEALVKELKEIMLKAYKDVKVVSKEYNTSLRESAYILATQRILKAEKERE